MATTTKALKTTVAPKATAPKFQTKALETKVEPVTPVVGEETKVEPVTPVVEEETTEPHPDSEYWWYGG